MGQESDSEHLQLVSGNSSRENGYEPNQQNSDKIASEHIGLHVYKRRWWILFVYFFVSVAQGILWNTWAPLADAAVVAFDWSDGEVTALPAVSNLSYIIFAFPVLYIIETYGLRASLLVTNFVVVVGTVAWVVGLVAGQYWLIMIGSLLVGVGPCVPLAAPAFLSTTWFPVKERTTATGAAFLGSVLGVGLGFITGPLVSGINVSSEAVRNRHNQSEEYISALKNGTQKVLYFDSGLAVACFILVLAYFPNKPPLPPSRSQAKERIQYLKGIKSLLTKPQFWMLLVAANATLGVYNTWLPLVSINLRAVGITQNTAGWIGFISMGAAAVSSLIVSRVMDAFKKKSRIVIMISTSVCLVLVAVLACILEGYIMLPAGSQGLILALFIGSCVFANGVVSLYYELGSEIVFPAREALVGTCVQTVNYGIGFIVFLLLLNPSLAAYTNWMNWTLLAAIVITLTLLFFVKDKYPRLDLDEEE